MIFFVKRERFRLEQILAKCEDIRLRHKHLLFLITLLVMVIFSGSVFASDTVYEKLLPSTALVIVKQPNDKVIRGSGVVVDAPKRWVLTNFHVVGGAKEVTVIFPARSGEQVVHDEMYYVAKLKQLSIPGRVIAGDAKRDLAIIQLDRLPDDVKAVKFASASARPGQWVHLIGNQIGTGALWNYSYGKARSVVRRQVSVPSAGVNVEMDARCLISSLNANLGDSGGPIVNDQAELVALYSHHMVKMRLVSGGVDISEIRTFLEQAKNKPAVAKKMPDGKAKTTSPIKSFPLIGKWNGTAKLEYDLKMRIVLTLQDNGQCQYDLEMSNGAKAKKTGAWQLRGDQLTLQMGGQKGPSGQIIWQDTNSFIMDDGTRRIEFRRMKT